jgi:hypothetical protein
VNTIQERRVMSQQESERYTPAQRVRQKHTRRRPLKHDRGLTPFRAILETCILAHEVMEDMLALGMDLDTEKLFCGILVQHVDGEYHKFRTIPFEPSADGISAATRETDSLTEPKVLGCIFRIYDFKAEPPAARTWARPFVPGETVYKILLRALREHLQQEAKTMTWFEAAKKLAPISLRMAIAWAHPDGRVVTLPFEDLKTTQGSLAETELRSAKFFPVQVLSITADDSDGVRVNWIPIPQLGTAERILAARVLPTAVQSFTQQAKKDGIVGDLELN